MAEQENELRMPTWALPAFSWLVSFYFLLGYVAKAGFPPSADVTIGQATLLGLWMFFLFLPFLKRIKIGSFLELEREIEKTKTELKEFRSEVRNNLSLISTSVNTIGSLSNQVTVNFPGLAELEGIKRRLDQQATPTTKREANEIRDELVLEGEDTAIALARTRMRLEYLLRRILGKRTVAPEPQQKQVRFMTLPQMFRLFVQQHEEYRHLEEPFSYVVQVCNAAVHAQRVPQAQAEEALDIGSRIIAILSDIAGPGELAIG